MPESLKRPCSSPGCGAMVRAGRCKDHAEPRFVVTGPPGSGKTTWVRGLATRGDLVWDLDLVVGALSYRGKGAPGRPPWSTIQAAIIMREALVDWLSTNSLDGEVAVFVIVTRPEEAKRIAKELGAELVELAARVEG